MALVLNRVSMNPMRVRKENLMGSLRSPKVKHTCFDIMYWVLSVRTYKNHYDRELILVYTLILFR